MNHPRPALLLVATLSVLMSIGTAWAQPVAFTAEEQQALLRNMDSRAAHFGELSRRIWDLAEVGYQEVKSAALLKDELRKAGFRIRENIGGIPTAFTATWGEGKPVIGIFGEYDALPGLYQEAVPEKKPRASLKPGHGCGHNLFGAGSAFAAIVVKETLSAKKLPGTIRFYGCPAEEGGGGKIYMGRDKAFDDCDAILAWHPSDASRASLKNNLANITAKFRFYGTAAHAGGSPEKGRSALDAVMLMCHAVDLLREHVPQTTRMHYVVTQGGNAPNIVPEFSELYLYARHPEMPILDGVWSRILKCAEAGGLATETRLEIELINSSYNILPNDALASLADKNLRIVGGLTYTAEEEAFAAEMRKTLINPPKPGTERIIESLDEGQTYGSTDVGDVSWLVPTTEFRAATWVPGCAAHSWQSTACSGMSIGRKGMVVAAKTLALCAMDLFTKPEEILAARSSFEKRKGEHTYRSRLPAAQKPPLDYRGKQ